MASNIIDQCKLYMLTNENISKYNLQLDEENINRESHTDGKTKKRAKENEKENEKEGKNESIYFTPYNSDKLFWCFYIILKGTHDYEINNNFKTEKEFKIESIELLRKIKVELKAMKLKLCGIEDELLNQKKIGIKSLVALCLLYKINVLYVWNRKFFEIVNNADEKTNIIINESRDDKLMMEVDAEKIEYYREKYLRIDNIEKPFKAVTAYTKEELLKIAEKLDLKNIDQKSKKKDIYEKIKFDCI